MLEKDFQKQVIRMIRIDFPEMFFYKASDKFIAGIPDIVGCHRGQMWAVELKVGSNKPTALQLHTMQKMREAGAKVIWSRDAVEIVEFLRGLTT